MTLDEPDGGPVVGSVTDTVLHLDEDVSKVEVGQQYGQILLKMGELDHFGLKID